jgi:hypothetical protein
MIRGLAAGLYDLEFHPDTAYVKPHWLMLKFLPDKVLFLIQSGSNS